MVIPRPPAEPEHVVPDAHAVLAFLGSEPGWGEGAEILLAGGPWMSRGSLGSADAVAAEAASLVDCPVLTGDPEFHVADEAGVAVRWLSRHT